MDQAVMERSALIAIDSIGGFHAEIDPLGAQLWRLRDRDGRDLLWNGDPAFWSGRAPVLFPIVGALRGDRYHYRGADYTLPRHGFARQCRWQVAAHERGSATFRLESNEAMRAVYPFDFALELTFTVSAAMLAMTVALVNRGDAVMPFGFGFHPALRWPFAGGRREDYRVWFERDEPGALARLDSAGLIDRRERSPVRGRELALSDALFADDALIWTGIRSRALRFGVPGGEQLRVAFPEFPDLGMWTKPGACYLCIEPWLGHADPAEPYGEIFAKPGICTLQPGQDWRAGMTIASPEAG